MFVLNRCIKHFKILLVVLFERNNGTKLVPASFLEFSEKKMKFCLKSERIEHSRSKSSRDAYLLPMMTQALHYFLKRNIIKREFIFLTSLECNETN